MNTIKILWIDDDVNKPELMAERDALEELGCNITPIPHPDLLHINMASLFDCIIIDLSMPTGNLPISKTRGDADDFALSIVDLINNKNKR